MGVGVITLWCHLFIFQGSIQYYTLKRYFQSYKWLLSICSLSINTCRQYTSTCTHLLLHGNTHKHAMHTYDRQYNWHNTTLTTTHVQEAIKQSKNNNSKGPDTLNIGHLNHIGPLGLAFLTSMLKTALNTNIILHIWMLVNIVPIPKPNKDIDKGISYRPISLLSVIAKRLEKSLLPYITANIPDTPTQHGFKKQHYTH